MRILLDECVDARFALDIVGHEVHTAPQMGWAGKRNGELLSLAAEQFDAFVTVDQNLQHQQNLAKVNLAIVVMRPVSNRLPDLRALLPALLEALPNAIVGVATIVE